MPTISLNLLQVGNFCDKPPAITEFDLQVAGLDNLKEYRYCIDSNDRPSSDFSKAPQRNGRKRNYLIFQLEFQPDFPT